LGLSERFVRWLQEADELAVFRINPFGLAEQFTIAVELAIELLLHATHQGLCLMEWLLLCPGCSDVVEQFRSLQGLHAHYRCNICQQDFEAALDDYIEVCFTVAPTVRPIRFHQPTQLSVEDFFRYYCFRSGARWEPRGILMADYLQQVIRYQGYVEPGQTCVFNVDLAPGLFSGCDRLNHCEFAVDVVAGSASPDQTLHLWLEDGATATVSATFVQAGPCRLLVDNQGPSRAALITFWSDPADHGTVVFAPFFNAKMLLNRQTFRDFFQHEALPGRNGLQVKDVTLLFTDLKSSTELYERIGDLAAFELVQEHFTRLTTVVAQHQGALVKTIGDAIMASFDTPLGAVQAALEMRDAIEAFNRPRGRRDLILKIGIHHGPAIAVTLNDQADYFGQTVNLAARVQGVAEADEICLTRPILEALGVAALLQDWACIASYKQLKGFQESWEITHVGRRAAVDG
jgi:class 3 adenylate cyclase